MTGRIRPATPAGLVTLTRRPARWARRHGKTLGHGVVTTAAVFALTLTIGVTPSLASPSLVAQQQAEKTLAEVRDAAAKTQLAPTEPAPAADPTGEGTITPDQSSTITAQDPDVEVTFSGHEIDEKLDVDLTPLPSGVADVAESETGGIAYSTPVEVTAVTGAGDEVTKFPAEVVTSNKQDAAGRTQESGPEFVKDIDPGVQLTIDVDEEDVKDIDKSTLKIMTRENAGDPWVEIPSYFDEDSKTMKGEIDHLSQFVVIGVPFVVPPGPTVVLDPDDNVGWAATPGPYVRELPYNIALAQGVRTMLQEQCQANVVVTREDPNVDFVTAETRANIAAQANPVATVTLAFNALTGTAWDNGQTSGGSQAFSRGSAADDALNASMGNWFNFYTDRPLHVLSSPDYPYAEFDSVPGAVSHFEALFLDNNYDRGLIDDPTGNGWKNIVIGTARGVGAYLESQGFNCVNPVTGGWPDPPSDAEKERWRQLGYNNNQMYGGDPVSFSTGNLVEDEPILSLTGPGDQDLDLSLIYNSQDGRESRVGTGWTFGVGARAQRFSDGSVMVVRGDGASFVFNSNGAGGYTGEQGLYQTLAEAPGGQLLLTAVDGQSWLFDAADIDGIGELVRQTDQQGNSYTLNYGSADPKTSRFVPLTSIVDAGGQTIAVENDAVGHITAFVHPDGRRWTLAYDGAWNLTAITNPDGRVRTFTYDGTHQLLTATNAKGVTYLSNEYDAQGRIVKQLDAAGRPTSISYDDAASETTYTDGEGLKTVFGYDEKKRITSHTDPLGQVSTYVYDDKDQVTLFTDEPGNKWAYSYDASGNVVEETLPDDTVVKYTWTPTGELASQTDQGGPNGADRTVVTDVDPLGLVTGLTLADGTHASLGYDGQGNMISASTPSGKTSTFTYDGRGNIVTQTDPLANVTTFNYDLANRVTSTTDPTGATTTLSWDAGDRLVSQTDALGGVTSYSYDANDKLVSTTDATGAVTSYTWDDFANLTSVTAPDGGVTSYEYNAEDELVKTTDSLGNVTTFELDDLYRPTGITDPAGETWTRQYDELGNVITSTDPLGGISSYAYDELGQLTDSTGPTGISTSTTFDEVGRVAKVTDNDGNSVEYEYDLADRLLGTTDQAGETTTTTYDIDSNVVAATDRLGHEYTYTYDAAGKLTGSIDPTGAATQLVYDPAGRVHETIDALGRRSTVDYDALGRATTVTDPLGNPTSYGYDALSRLVSITDANGNSGSTTYNPTGTVASITDALGATTAFGYDLNGQQTSTIDPDGNETRYSYDPAGQLSKVVEGFDASVPDAATGSSDVNVTTRYDWTPTGNLAKSTDPNGHETVFDYNAAGQVTSETNPVGKSWTYNYDSLGRLASQIDGNSQTTSYEYTARSDLASVTYPDSSVSFEYDANQQAIAMTDPLGVTGWKYDDGGQVTEQIDPTGSRLGYDYDAAGQLTALTMPTGDQIGYRYDAAGRPIAQTSPWGDLAYEWDPAGNLTSLLRSTGVATDYTYDAANQVTQIQHTAPASPSTADTAPASTVETDAAPAKPVTTEVDQCVTAAGYLENRAIPAAGATSHECVKTGDYLDRRTVPDLPDPVENVDTITFDYSYDPAGNVTNATRTLGSLDDPALPEDGTTPDAGTTPSVSSPDPTPAFPAVLETPKVDSRDYSYDSLNRLVGTTANTGNTAEYAYDPAGNRTTATTTTADGTTDVTSTFNEANQLTASQTATTAGTSGSNYEYDGNGNRTSQNENGVSTGFSYQTDNRLTGVNRDGRSTSYAYDGLGRQLSRTENSQYGAQTTQNVWDGTSIVQQSNPVSGTSALMRDAFGEVALQTGAGEPSWTLLDGLGTTAAQAVGGSVAQLSTFDDWGNQSFDTIGWNSAVNYTGETTDAGYGLNNYFARTYDPTTGSWMSQDSWRGLLTAPQTAGRYAYVINNPTSLVDANGNEPYRPSQFTGASHPTNMGAPGTGGIAGDAPPSSDGAGRGSPVASSGGSGGCVPSIRKACSKDETKKKIHKTEANPCANIRHCVTGGPSTTFPSGETGSPSTAFKVGEAATEFFAGQPTLREIANKPLTIGAGVWARANGADGCRSLGDGFVTCYGVSGGYGGGGTTIGDVFISPDSFEVVSADTAVLDHERQHANQWAGFSGIGFGIAYSNEAQKSQAASGDYACQNWFEANADFAKGNYTQCVR